MSRFLKILTPVLVLVLMLGSVLCSQAAAPDVIDPLSSWVTYTQWKDKDGTWHDFNDDMRSKVKGVLDSFETYDSSSFFAYDGYMSGHGYHVYVLSSSAYFHVSGTLSDTGYPISFVDKRVSGELAIGNSYWYEFCLHDDGSVTYSTDINKSYYALKVKEILASRKDIYTDIEQSAVFFHPAEPPVLATAVAPVNLAKTLEPVMQILPIGLACLASYVGFRKALALLRRMLYQA